MTRKGQVPGLKLLLEGEPGTGKTYSLRSAFALGYNLRFLFLDASQSSVGDLPFEGEKTVQWKHVKPAYTNWADLEAMFKSVQTDDNQTLQRNSIAAKEQTQMMEVLTICNNFISDRDGKSYGDVSSWGTDTIFVLDGLSKLTEYAMRMAVGLKPILSQPDWGVVQNTLKFFINRLVDNLHCHFVLISHVDREIDELRGGTRKYPSTAGRKLGPRIPEVFDDVIMTYRKDDKFLWRTYGDDDAMIKGRSVGLINNVPADFKIVMDAWKKRGGIIES